MQIHNKPKSLLATLFMMMTVFFTACNNQENTAAEQTNKSGSTVLVPEQLVFDKLVGTWQNEDGKNFEQWTKKEDGTFRSIVFKMKGKDTLIEEQARIYPENDKWVFDNIVSGQNEGRPVKFTAGTVTGNTVQFSNPAHDFPNDINYTLPDNNTINAFIVGRNQKGGLDTIPFNYTRVK